MASRLELQSKLEELLGNRNVYHNSPESIKMNYPAIKYKKTKIDVKRSNNTLYTKTNCYELIVMDLNSDNPVIEKLLELPYCTYDRHYTANGLHHDVLTLYY